MKNRSFIIKKLLFPPIWLISLLALFCAALLTLVFVKDLSETPVAYGVYVVSAYALTVLSIFLADTLPKHYKKMKRRAYSNPFGRRYMTDAEFKVRISLYISLTINLLYSVFKLITGVFYGSLWWIAVAVYYMLLSLLRFSLLRYMKTDESRKGIIQEFRRYRLCGILMLILNLSLSGIVFQIVRQNKGYTYPGVLIFVVAAYTFYAVTNSVIDIVKYRKYESPIIAASKAIRLGAALVTILSMETAMLEQFGSDESFRRIMTASTGAGVCIVVLTMSGYMIARANKEIKKLQSERSRVE